MGMDPLSFLDAVAGHTAAQYPVQTPMLGTVDPAYTSGNPKITFDGETTLSGKTYLYAGYTPAPGDRVVLLPVGNSYLILGAVGVLDGRGKAPLVHTHAESDVTSLGTDLAGKAATVHTHEPTDITAVTQHEACYTASGGQSIPTSTDTPLAFATGTYTTADVTIGTSTGGSIANAAFTLNRGGLWIVEGGCRIGNAVSGKSYGIWLGPDGGSTRYRAQFADAGGTDAMEFAVAVCSRFSAGTVLNLNFWHDEGVARSTVLLNGGNSIRFAWLRP